MELAYRLMNLDEVATEILEIPGWSKDGGTLYREFSFETYLAGVVFAVAVAHQSEGLNHHPDLGIGYKKVTVRVSTHDVGGISPYDFELARRVSALVDANP
jgi:4a-hydroxytetrahydrobiopterin dehydratase